MAGKNKSSKNDLKKVSGGAPSIASTSASSFGDVQKPKNPVLMPRQPYQQSSVNNPKNNNKGGASSSLA